MKIFTLKILLVLIARKSQKSDSLVEIRLAFVFKKPQ